ncbi:hypothetical protein NY2A_B346L [Paramecium bursaria Chlorella virus NY2A]|uniref:Uncharacterized protein B346L n=1 Tax=Paramecium bursaria Chlorella virus NY2A TaxID=46021 RepID=A7IWM1_PBCVN|nr:hypothetical protein NY2A_B346L [Paramecium bursaria Chlorella virus NY2A]ABT14745.1 hypothetical protein NY2A_B346L [Paramecium bursaria Chlorella virus NY2A]
MGNHSYFYIWTHRNTGKQYVGITTQKIGERIQKHRSKSSNCTKLRNAIQKHGFDAFDVEYFEWCDPDDLGYIEDLLINELVTLSPGGYNLKTGGRYGKHNEDTKKKIGDSKRGEKNHNYGKKISEETKTKLSNALSGKKHYMFGKPRECNPIYGIRRSNETRKKISEATSGDKNPMFGKTGVLSNTSKKVYQYDKQGNYIQSFASCGEAGRYFKKNSSHISECARGDRKSAYKFRWSYKKFTILATDIQ